MVVLLFTDVPFLLHFQDFLLFSDFNLNTKNVHVTNIHMFASMC